VFDPLGMVKEELPRLTEVNVAAEPPVPAIKK
jgi:hypothetical protein